LAELADPAIWGGPEHKRWLDQLEIEIANLRSALAWLEAVGDNAGFLRLAAALGGLWHFRSYRVEGRDWLRRAVARDPGSVPEARATALVKLAILNRELDGVSSPELVEETIAIRRKLGLEDLISGNLLFLSDLLDPANDADKIAQLTAEATNIFECSHDRLGLAVLRWREGVAAFERGDVHLAWTLIDGALSVLRREATPFWLTVGFLDMASIELELGRIAEAASHYSECFDLWNDTGSRECIVAAIAGTGRLALANGRPGVAVRLLGASTALGDALGYKPRRLERTRIDRAVAETRAALGDRQFDETWASASKVSFDVARIEAVQTLAATENHLVGVPSKNVRVIGGLSPREHDVLRLIAEGRSNREIAEQLSISVPTVKRHLTTIFAKLNLPSRAAAVAYAHTHGFA
jgi:DNA-binding CsgD family transcriptional regulator